MLYHKLHWGTQVGAEFLRGAARPYAPLVPLLNRLCTELMHHIRTFLEIPTQKVHRS